MSYKFILKEIVSRNGAGTDTYERYARWSGIPRCPIIGFDSFEDARRQGEKAVAKPYNGIVNFEVEAVR